MVSLAPDSLAPDVPAPAPAAPAPDEEDYVLSCIRKGVAPIFKHHLAEVTEVERPQWGEKKKETEPTEKTAAEGGEEVKQDDGREAGQKREASEGVVANQANPKKRPKGPQVNVRVIKEASVCEQILKSGSCRFGDKCRYMHDIDAFMAAKPEDLPGTCHLQEVNGTCPYGIKCRWARSHKPAEEPQSATAQNRRTQRDFTIGERNNLDMDSREQLRRKTYPFPLAAKVAPWGKNGLCDGQRKKDDPILGDPPKEETKTAAADESMAEAPLEETKPREMVEDKPVGALADAEKKQLNLKGKTILAPLTTLGNLPYRRVCKRLGADVTVGEMAMCYNLIQGKASEWSLMRRHESEDIFGVQICAGFANDIAKTMELMNNHCEVDFVDINMGCPIDLVVNAGAGSALLARPGRLEAIVKAACAVSKVPVTVKVRMGFAEKDLVAHTLIPKIFGHGAAAVTVHGRTRAQRYLRSADWDYIKKCHAVTPDDKCLVGNGDIYSWDDARERLASGCSDALMIGRSALIKPWIFTEIKEQRIWDISASERMDMLKEFCNYGFEHWGSDQLGVEHTRRFLLEWQSFLCRYIPAGILETVPPCTNVLNLRPPRFVARNDTEALLSSTNCQDWIKIAEMMLGPAPEGFNFHPKHKSNSYESNG